MFHEARDFGEREAGEVGVTTDGKRLIEVDFPLEQVSLDSVHEKMCHAGHIKAIHSWPARRPLAACRAVLIATLLPDPVDPGQRKEIYRRLAGTLIERIDTKRVNGRMLESRTRETQGGVLQWGRESSPDVEWFRARIRDAYNGRAPRILDPFAGGGAIPIEAMRLGCEVTAADINPVAWFILKCTLEYPQKFAGQTRPLPDFALKDREFMESFLKAKGIKNAAMRRQLAKLGLDGDKAVEPELLAHDPLLDADLAWQVRAWGRWVLAEARKELASRYPTYAEFQALEPGGKPFEARPIQLLEPNPQGKAKVEPLNASFAKSYLDDPRKPRWVAKPTVAYMWARTARCKGCRATIPLLKTRWLAKKENKRVLLTMEPNTDRSGVVFGIEVNVPRVGGNAAQRREHDRRRGAGTMTRSGAQCPCCPTIMTMEDLRLEGQAGRLGTTMTVAVVDGYVGKEYRTPTEFERKAADVSSGDLDALYAEIPFGCPTERLPGKEALGFRVPLYGMTQWQQLFTSRQLYVLGTLCRLIRTVADQQQAIASYLALILSKTSDYNSTLVPWQQKGEKGANTFQRWALPMKWDFVENNILLRTAGGFESFLEWVSKPVEHALPLATRSAPAPTVVLSPASSIEATGFDAIITDPPYYDAIPYSDLMDFFHVWLRRATHGLSRDVDTAFQAPLSPKWDHDSDNGELIDDPSRFGGDKNQSKANYEAGMARVFETCHGALKPDGRLVVVFANKQPDAWEVLVAALVKAGFVVDASWPIKTEMGNRQRAMASAALASSVWLVCRKRAAAQPGWDTSVLADMRARIETQLRGFWDAGIRGPDFVWAATGPALEAYSKYPVVKKADEPNSLMTVSEFLREVRRLVVDFVVGRVLNHSEGIAGSLDDTTTYYLLHRNDFGLDDAPIGACILYALSCNLSDAELADRLDVLSRTGRTRVDDLEDGDEEDGDEPEEELESGGKGNKVKLRPWNQRKAKWLGYEGQGGRPVPLIDQAHRLMHLWRAGDENKVDDYLDTRGLKRNAMFAQLLQALIELAAPASEERSILESISNHIVSRGGIGAPRQAAMEV